MISPGLLDMDRIDFISVLNRLDDGVIIADAGGTILFYNTAQSKIDGVSPQDAIGLKVTDIYELNNRTSMIMQVIQHQAPIKNRAFFYRTSSGKVANTITSVYPLFNQKTFNGVICLVKDYELLYKSTPMTAITECRSDLGNGTQYTFADLIGSGADFQRVVATARKAASSTSPIMIQGETGTGKELVAQSIHNESLRRREKYVGINCAAIPHDLLEGMLFGTTRGAFTGALNKPGLFEIAHRGTLFLDELLAMPVDLQAKLLRALQEKCIRRLGSAEETRVDVKVISSVSLPPRKAVRENRLRTDLFYRLAVVMVKLPPLRDRQTCMEELVQHFIEKYNALLGTQVRQLSQEVFDLFAAYQWPGNIRELEHLIEGAMNLAGYDDTIGIKHFSPGLDSLEQLDFSGPDPGSSIPANTAPGNVEVGNMETGDPKSRQRPNPVSNQDQFSPPKQNLTRNLAQDQSAMEKAAVKAALYAAHGNVTKAARQLCISRQLLHYKIKKHGFSRLDFV